jgi:glycine/D-amino acid oxidase-like deaminating enzyme/nitrite reductase/ring-hydroxylating ferredoxin subunit
MEIHSVFEDVNNTNYPALTHDLHIDVAVIGGGITGLTSAGLISKQGKSVAVLEAHRIGKGATGNSTGNLYATVGNKGLHGVESKFDKETVKMVVRARAMAVAMIKSHIDEFGIDCDFKYVPWCLFAEGEEGKSHVEKEKKAAEEAGLNVANDASLPVNTTESFNINMQAQFNPYRYVVGLAAGVENFNCSIYENTQVTEITEENGKVTLKCGTYTVTAGKVVMATHTPKGVYKVHTLMGPYREYAVAVTLNGNYPADGTYWDMFTSEHYSMRTYESLKGKVLLALGQIHKVGQKVDNEECFAVLENFLRERFDVNEVAYRWAAQMYKPADTLPYIGTTSADSNIYIATGYSADGLTYGTLAAKIIADDIAGVHNEYAKTFDAKRHTPIASASEFIKENVNVAAQLVKNLPFVDDGAEFAEIQPGDGKIVDVRGSKYAAYRNESGQLEVVSALCTHMGCVVNWNSSEKSWDCPCHGSRFGTCGSVIEGPAFTNLPKADNSKVKE